jgi:hypothetical protein
MLFTRPAVGELVCTCLSTKALVQGAPNLDVKNLFDRDHEEGAFGNVYAYFGEPRTVQVGVSYTL